MLSATSLHYFSGGSQEFESLQARQSRAKPGTLCAELLLSNECRIKRVARPGNPNPFRTTTSATNHRSHSRRTRGRLSRCRALMAFANQSSFRVPVRSAEWLGDTRVRSRFAKVRGRHHGRSVTSIERLTDGGQGVQFGRMSCGSRDRG